jgi:SIR2-like domain
MSSRSIFPPPFIADLGRHSAGRFLDLTDRVRSGPITIFLGAGVSASAGLPTWPKLLEHLCQVFFGHWNEAIGRGSATIDRPPKDLSIVFAHPGPWWHEDVLRVGERFSQGNPLLAAQQIKNCIRDRDWRWLLRKALYTSADERDVDTSQSDLLTSISRLCASSKDVRAVVNYNYDDTLEDYLKQRDVPHSVVPEPNVRVAPGNLPIYHIHGYLKRGGGPKTPLVLAENEYHDDSSSPYSWANLVQTSLLTTSTCLFLGMSLSDPNLRRLLHLLGPARQFWHYALLPADHETVELRMANALYDKDLQLLGIRSIRYPVLNELGREHSRLCSLVDQLLSG